MPGIASLKAQAYYAHPRNAFWPILQAWQTGDPPCYRQAAQLSSEERSDICLQADVAVWDVLARCERSGSLDAAIDVKHSIPNDIVGLLHRHPGITRLVFNGKNAAALYQRHLDALVQQEIETQGRVLERHTLPSTSPAMASLTLEQKFRLWKAALEQ